MKRREALVLLGATAVGTVLALLAPAAGAWPARPVRSPFPRIRVVPLDPARITLGAHLAG